MISLKKYFAMTKQQRRHELQSTLWYTPLIYILLSFILAGVTLYLDLNVNISQYVHNIITFQAQPTRILVSTLIGGILTLSAFTFNSLVVALTTFSSQFSPRMLLNFVADKTTQHVLGIFNGSFIYVLVIFLFITRQDQELFMATPFTTILLALLTAITFIYFINHTTTWLQVHNIVFNMKSSSEKIINESLLKETVPFRAEEFAEVNKEGCQGEKKSIKATKSGYVQILDLKKLIEQAKKDNTVIKLEYAVGDFVLEDTALITYWSNSSAEINENGYRQMVQLGYKKTELQDLEFGINKLSEIAVKAIGSSDPQTVTNAIHQLTDLLKKVSKVSSFSPYLLDENQKLRVILKEENFKYFLYKGFAGIRKYAGENSMIIAELIAMLALLARSIHQKHHEDLWEFAAQTITGFQDFHMYENDCYYLMGSLYELAKHADKEAEYPNFKKKILKRIAD